MIAKLMGLVRELFVNCVVPTVVMILGMLWALWGFLVILFGLYATVVLEVIVVILYVLVLSGNGGMLYVIGRVVYRVGMVRLRLEYEVVLLMMMMNALMIVKFVFGLCSLKCRLGLVFVIFCICYYELWIMLECGMYFELYVCICGRDSLQLYLHT